MLLLKLTRQKDADLRNENDFNANDGGACNGICKVEIWGKDQRATNDQEARGPSAFTHGSSACLAFR